MMPKQWTLLCAYMLIICDMYMSQAAPSRSNKELFPNGAMVSDTDVEKLLKTMKDFMQMIDEQEQSADENSNTTAQKRGCNTSTCVTHRLADLLSRSGGLGYSNFVHTNVGAQAFGRKKRHGPV